MTVKLFGIRPLLWPTLITFPAVLLALGLGTWQVQRLTWKNAVIADRQAKRAAPPLAGLPAQFDPALHEFRRASVEGRFRHDKELYLAARSMNGNAGYHVLTPLALAGGQGHVLVNRGWVPLARKEPDSRAPGQADGAVTVEGYLRHPAERGWFVPENVPQRNFWFTIDLPAMAAAQDISELKPYVFEADAAPNRGGFPIGGVTRFELPNDHLQYAITWFAMAAIGAAVYVLYHRRRAREPAAAGAPS